MATLADAKNLWKIMGFDTSNLGKEFTGTSQQIEALKGVTGGQFSYTPTSTTSTFAPAVSVSSNIQSAKIPVVEQSNASIPIPTIQVQQGNTTMTIPEKDLGAWRANGWRPIGETTPTPTPILTPTTIYSPEFEQYWASINPTFPKTEANKKAQWEQYQAMGNPKNLENQILNKVQEKIESGLIQPDVEISQQMVDDFLKQVKEEVAPYFSEQIRQKREDYSRALGQIGEDITANERKLAYDYGQNLQNIQEQMANRGLAFSSIRGGKEQNLLSQTQAAVEAGRREAERRALEAGTTAERTLGTSNLPETVGKAQAPKPILGKPGVYGFEPGTGTRTLFAPVGGVTGSLEQERLLAEKARQKELVGAERQLRGTAYL